jgi:hypothetical protein
MISRATLVVPIIMRLRILLRRNQKRNLTKRRFFEGFCGTGPADRFRTADPAVKRLYSVYKSIGLLRIRRLA